MARERAISFSVRAAAAVFAALCVLCALPPDARPLSSLRLVAAGAAESPPARCPARVPTTILSLRAGARVLVAPHGARSLILCRYHGLNPAPLAGRLEATRVVSRPAEISVLTSEFNALPRQSATLVHCPMDDGSEILASFRYPEGPPDPISVHVTGCQTVSNGRLTRTASLPPGPALLRQLASLL